jgi:hypothetical protein
MQRANQRMEIPITKNSMATIAASPVGCSADVSASPGKIYAALAHF